MIKVWDIHGGIHPQENKNQSNQRPIESAGIPDRLVFPLSQHIGVPAVAIVSVGQHVLKGEMIAGAKGMMSVPVHASTSGEIVAIQDHPVPHPSTMSAPCVILKPDGKDQWIEHQGVENYLKLEKNELLNHIRNAGIAGMGGAGFPSAVKLNIQDEQIVETLIINGTECEPYITSDDRLMRERANEIVAGIKILEHLINPTKKTLVGVEDNKPEALAALQQAADGTDIDIVSFPTKYPSGGEKQLIQILTGKEVPAGGLPADVGVVCQNIGTSLAIYRAIAHGEPLISRITTVTGNACERNTNYEVLLGTPVSFLLDLCNFHQKNCSRLIMGGPMMGFTLENVSVPIVKTSNCILAPTADELPLSTPSQACIRCGMCAEVCPASLLPQQLYWFSRGKEYEKLEAHNLMDCIECGACSYACPSNIPLVQYYRASKADIRQLKQDAIKAEQSKMRFEARQERLDRQEAEKEAKRKARKLAAEERARDNNKSDPIQAAIDRAKAKKAAIDSDKPIVGKTSALLVRQGLEKTLTNIENRLLTATEKLRQAEQENSANVEAFRTSVEKTNIKCIKAKQELDVFNADNPVSSGASSIPVSISMPAEKKVLTGDAAQDAIAKALAKRDAASNMTDEERLQNAVTAITKRLEKAQQKLTVEKQKNGEHIELLASAVTKLELKLADANDAYLQFRQATNNQP
ncbi:MAG: electron transport complex subunit RsxC [Oceanicoccus sp.]